ncbi:hypothetical protein [Halapricum salinum]|uniref:Uncharacterized protein n=1 Tax=Halapricum salinum TaxID=1457250 RepID=A0A4D6HGP4_9EURY|nr:hypothetical protein [Halapricum salinum]QCC52406.1 hypothetical protein DV733_14705 [Halapricum salinum]
MGTGETIEAIVESNDDPLVRESASGEETFEPQPGHRAVGVLTDRRIVLAGGPTTTRRCRFPTARSEPSPSTIRENRRQ